MSSLRTQCSFFEICKLYVCKAYVGESPAPKQPYKVQYRVTTEVTSQVGGRAGRRAGNGVRVDVPTQELRLKKMNQVEVRCLLMMYIYVYIL